MRYVRPVVLRFVANPRVRVPVLVLVGIGLLSVLQRAAVLLGHAERLEGVGAANFVRSLAVGLCFDLVVAALLTLPLLMILCLAPASWLTCKWFRRGLSGLTAVILAAVTFAGVADFSSSASSTNP